MIGLLVWLLIFLVVFYVSKLIIDEMGLSENIRKIVMLILGLIALLMLLGQLGVAGPYYRVY